MTISDFNARRRYNADAIALINKFYVPVIPLLLVILTAFPLQVVHSDRFQLWSYIAANVAIIVFGSIRGYQLSTKRQLPFIAELVSFVTLLSIGLLVTLFLTGFQHPITVFWMFVFFIGYLIFGVKGYLTTFATFLAMAVLDYVYFAPPNDAEYVPMSVIYFIALSIISYLLAKMMKLTATKEETLAFARREERRQKDQLQVVINNMAEGLMSVDRHGRVSLHNATVLSILDTNTSLKGRPINEILKLKDANDEPVDAKVLIKGTKSLSHRTDLRHSLTEQDTINVSLQISPIRTSYGGKANEGYVVIIRDITKEKSLDEERDEFISVVSHELRTPITIAEGTLSNLQLMISKSNVSQDIFNKNVDEAHKQVIFLAKMVNDLSTLSRAERGVGNEAEVIDVKELITNLYNEYEPQAREKGLHLNLDIDHHLGAVETSRLYLQELLQNFVTNAIKYTKEGTVTVIVRKKANKLTFEVKDTGIGISKTDREKVFNKFYRSEDYRTRETGGTGLGLYVAVKLAKKLSTKINLESRLNHGSSFSFVLPIKDKE